MTKGKKSIKFLVCVFLNSETRFLRKNQKTEKKIAKNKKSSCKNKKELLSFCSVFYETMFIENMRICEKKLKIKIDKMLRKC